MPCCWPPAPRIQRQKKRLARAPRAIPKRATGMCCQNLPYRAIGSARNSPTFAHEVAGRRGFYKFGIHQRVLVSFHDFAGTIPPAVYFFLGSRRSVYSPTPRGAEKNRRICCLKSSACTSRAPEPLRACAARCKHQQTPRAHKPSVSCSELRVSCRRCQGVIFAGCRPRHFSTALRSTYRLHPLPSRRDFGAALRPLACCCNDLALAVMRDGYPIANSPTTGPALRFAAAIVRVFDGSLLGQHMNS